MSAHPAGPLHAETLPAVGAPARPADLSTIDPAVWPLTAKRVAGELHLGGSPVTDLVKQHGTPTVFLDEADFRARARGYATAFAGADGEADADVYYASKAFLCRGVAKWADEENLGIDVCTGGELAVVLSAGFPPERITLHGNNKSVEELAAALDAGVGHIVLDSFDEIGRLVKLAAERGVTPKVLIRVTVGVEAHTHEFIATAHEDQKFGFSLSSGSAAEAVRTVLNTDELRLVGLHSHIGSQIFDTAGFSVSSHRLVGLLAEIDAEHGVTLDELNLGGGLGIAYVSGDDPTDVREVASQLRDIVAAECRAAGLAVPRLSVEPGRALIGPAGVTLYRVGTVKDVDGIRTYVSVDGGMSDNIRTALYDAKYTCVLANRVSDAEPMLSRVVGKHCESGDIVIRDVWLPSDVTPGDLLAVAATGAYCRSMASNYNYIARPPVVAVSDGESWPLVRRETIEDILRLDVG